MIYTKIIKDKHINKKNVVKRFTYIAIAFNHKRCNNYTVYIFASKPVKKHMIQTKIYAQQNIDETVLRAGQIQKVKQTKEVKQPIK